MGCAKKLCENCKKLNENRWIHVKERGATRILFYSIGVVVPVFITGVRIKKSSAPFISPNLAEKVHFYTFRCLKLERNRVLEK